MLQQSPGPLIRGSKRAPGCSFAAASQVGVDFYRSSVRMNRLGLGRALGDWRNAGARALGPLGFRTSPSGSHVTASLYGTSSASVRQQPQPQRPPRVVVLGGGFGGLYAAVRLGQLLWPRGRKPQVTLVDQCERFTFKPLLYELLGGGAAAEEVAPPFEQLLAGSGVRFVQAQVTAVHPASSADESGSNTVNEALDYDPPSAAGPEGGPEGGGGHVALSDGCRLPYDYLVVALGSQPDCRGVAGVRDWALPFNSWEDAMRVRGSLDLLADSGSGGRVVVVGGGYAGVELAAVLAERCRSRGAGSGVYGGAGVEVRLLTPGSDILEGGPPGQREAAHRVLRQLGVRLDTGVRVTGLSAPSPSASSLPSACTLTYTLTPPRQPHSHAEPHPQQQQQSQQQQQAPYYAQMGQGDATAAVSASASFQDQQPQPQDQQPQDQQPQPQQPEERLAADLVVWTAGSAPATREAREGRSGFPFPTNERGAVLTEPSLRVLDTQRVFALGDVAVAASASAPSASSPGAPSPQQPGQQPPQQPPPLPATAQVAFQQADYAAWNIWAAINGRPLLPFRYQHLGSMMSLGQLNAAVALPLPLPHPLAAALRSAPLLGTLLGAAGVRLGSEAEAAAAAGAAGTAGNAADFTNLGAGVGSSSSGGAGGVGVTLEGPLAALLRRGAYLYRQPTPEQRLGVAAGWLRAGLRAAAELAGKK